MSSPNDIAIVTPSFARDLELCCTLNRSVLEFLPAGVRHYIVVDRRDMRLFQGLRGDRTIVLSKQDIVPNMLQLPKSNRWLMAAPILPVHGWLVQQIAKIAMAKMLSEHTLLMVDSDAVFVRDVDLAIFSNGTESRLFTQRGAIGRDMAAHVTWHRNACALLGISVPFAPPLDDYIGQVISWKRDLVLEMCARIETTSGRPWYEAIARTRQFSEYMTYGLFAEHVAGRSGNVWIDEHPRCNSHWNPVALSSGDIQRFVDALDADDLAMMISTHSRTRPDIRAAVISLATQGRL